jgi:thiol-disulfide isomerase/thioredoxin
MKKIKYYLKETLYFVVIITILANIISLYKSQDLSEQPLRLNAVKLINNQNYKIPADRPVLLHFWATWCPTCKLEASNIDFLAKYFEVITIAVKSGSDNEIKKYLDEHNYHFKVINDKDGRFSTAFHISAFPTTFIYDKKHNLSFSEVGYTSTFGLYLRMWWAGIR